MMLSKSLDGVAENLSATQLDVQATKEGVIATLKVVNAMQEDADEEKRKQMIRNVTTWLTYTDPTTSHQAANRKRQSGTGQWLINGVKFREWKRSRGSFMWLKGIRELSASSTQFTPILTAYSRVRKDNTSVSIV